MFDSTKTALHDLLRQAEAGKLQLPDFQRSWVWDDYGIRRRPSTVIDAAFSPDRLLYLSSRLSAAYKGVTALLMAEGARDFQSGQPYEYTNFWDENVDIHHIFPKAWCRSQGVDGRSMDSVINKTPLSSAANRAIGGVAPSKYVARLEERTGLDGPDLDRLLESHAIPAAALRADDFAAFFAQRRERLLDLIARATDIRIHRDEGESDEPIGEEVIDREREPRVDIDDNADALGA